MEIPPQTEEELISLAHTCRDPHEFEKLLKDNRRLLLTASERGIRLSLASTQFVVRTKLSGRARDELRAKAFPPGFEAVGQPARRQIVGTVGPNFNEDTFTPESHWTREIFFMFNEGSEAAPVDLAGRPFKQRYSQQQVIGIVKDAFASDLDAGSYRLPPGWFPMESFRLSGVDPTQGQALAAQVINASPNARVFELRLRTPGGKKSIVMPVCQDGFDSEAHKHLHSQYRNMMFFRFALPPDILEPTGRFHPALRRTLAPRSGCPPELAEPYLEHYGRIGGDQVYMFTVQKLEGVELNRFDGNYVSNPKGRIRANDAESMAIGKEIIRIVTQLYSSTFDPASQRGFIPGVNINNGDFIIKPGDLMHPKLGRIAIAQAFNGGPEAFVDEILSPKNYWSGQPAANAWIIPLTVENLPHIVEAVEAGLRPLFPKQARELARSWFKTYAERQEADFETDVGRFKQVHRVILSPKTELEAGRADMRSKAEEILATSEWAAQSRFMYNPYFKIDFAVPISNLLDRGTITAEAVDELARKVRPLVCPSDIIRAIKSM